MALGSILSIDLTRDSVRLISISRQTVVSGNSINSASSFLAPEEDLSPNNVALTHLTYFPPPCLTGTSVFLFVLPWTCTSTSKSWKLGTSVFPAFVRPKKIK